jgi:hypothetical protein
MVTTHLLCHPDLSFPIRYIGLLVAGTTLLGDPTLTKSPYAVLSSVDVDSFGHFLGRSMAHRCYH